MINLRFLTEGKDDLRGVNDFLNRHAMERANCIPPSMLDTYCVAYEGGKILACCGATMARMSPLHLEDIYIFSADAQKMLRQRSRLSEIGRWFSIDPRAAAPVVRGLIEWLQERQVTFALCEMQKGAASRAQSIGLEFIPVDARLDFSQIDPTELGYYQKKTPVLYRLNFSEIHRQFAGM